MDREGGFITIHRQIESWEVWPSLTAEQGMVVFMLLLHANWKPSFAWFGSTRIPVGRGQVYASEETIARWAKTSRKVVRTTLLRLAHSGFITRELGQHAGRQPAIITIVNYDRFQGSASEVGPQKEQQWASSGPAVGQQGAPSEEGKQGEQGKEEKIPLTLVASDAQAPKPRKPRAPKDPSLEALRADMVQMYRDAKREELDWPPSAYGDLQAIRNTLMDDTEVKRRWGLYLADTHFYVKNIHKFRGVFQYVKFQTPPKKPAPTGPQIPRFS